MRRRVGIGLRPQPASPVSTGQYSKVPQNRAVPRHFADTAWSPCREFGYRSGIPAPGLRGGFLVSRFSWRHLSETTLVVPLGAIWAEPEPILARIGERPNLEENLGETTEPLLSIPALPIGDGRN
jgi:hypothetical protein